MIGDLDREKMCLCGWVEWIECSFSFPSTDSFLLRGGKWVGRIDPMTKGSDR